MPTGAVHAGPAELADCAGNQPFCRRQNKAKQLKHSPKHSHPRITKLLLAVCLFGDACSAQPPDAARRKECFVQYGPRHDGQCLVSSALPPPPSAAAGSACSKSSALMPFPPPTYTPLEAAGRTRRLVTLGRPFARPPAGLPSPTCMTCWLCPVVLGMHAGVSNAP